MWNDADVSNSTKGVEIRSLAFKSLQKIQIPGLGISLDVNATLKGESCLWIYTRSVDVINQSTVIIRINKEEKSQRIFISLGTYIKDKDNQNVFKIFSRQQLIDFTSKFNL